MGRATRSGVTDSVSTCNFKWKTVSNFQNFNFFFQNSILERKNEWKIKIKKLFVCYFSKFDKCSLMAAHELKCFSFDFILFIKIYIVDLAENFCLTIFWLGLEKVEKVFWSRKFPFGHEKIVKNLFRSKTKINNSN